MQPFQLFSCSGSGIAAMAGAEVQLWQLSCTSSAAMCSNSSSDSLAAMQPYSRAAMQPCSLAAVQPCQPYSPAALICSLAAPSNSPAASQPYGLAVPMKSLKT